MYADCCPARFGNTGDMLRPSGPWQAEQTPLASAVGLCCACAAPVPAARRAPIAIARSRFMIGRLEVDPAQEVDCVVVLGVPAEAIVVGIAAVELAVHQIGRAS